MFAVIKTGGKQYRVSKDDVIAVEKLAGEPGDLVEISDVLMVSEEGQEPTVGTPIIDKAAVFAELVEQTRGKKIIVFKKQRRQNHRRKNGHRQDLTILRIEAISPTGEKPAFTAKAKVATPKAAPIPAEDDDGEAPVKAKAKSAPKAKAAAKPKAAPKAKAESKPKAAKSGDAAKAAAKKPAKSKE